MQSLGTFSIITVSLSLLPSTQGNSGKCYEDWECGVGFYCSSNLCENCVPCEDVFNRQSSPNPSGEPFCAKSVSECGPCLQGFQDHGLRNQKCYPSKESNISSSNTVAVPSAWTIFVLGFLGCIIKSF